MSQVQQRVGAILLFAVGMSIAATAIAQTQPPGRTCVVKCGDEVVSEFECEQGTFCCSFVDCTTGLFAENCCSQTEDCESGLDPETDEPFADCIAMP